jgi:NADH-quinone oxidoreductase subunit J
MNPILFWSCAAVAVIAAGFVISRRSPLASALALAVNMVALAALFAGLSAPFLFIIQLLVYAGAVVVFIVFVIMLLNLGEEETRGRLVSRGNLLACGLACCLGLALLLRAVAAGTPREPAGALPADFGGIESLGQEIFTRWLLPFEVMGLILLVGIVGAVVLAKRGE